MKVVAKKKINWKKVLFIIVGVLLIGLAVVLIAQGIYFSVLNHDGQIAQFGFYKSDVSILPAGKRVAETCCYVGGIASLFSGGFLFCHGIGIFDL